MIFVARRIIVHEKLSFKSFKLMSKWGSFIQQIHAHELTMNNLKFLRIINILLPDDRYISYYE